MSDGTFKHGNSFFRHNRRSIRLKGYDYSQPGLYFITICTYKRAYLFGKIETGTMLLNDAGRVAKKCWMEISEHFPHAILHEYIVMPNHIHGIIELIDNSNVVVVGSENFLTLQLPKQNEFQKIIPRSIGSIVRGYKIGVTKWFRHVMPEYFPVGCAVWHRNYYEHIIRNQKSYENISQYIINNPKKWQEDRFYGTSPQERRY